MVTQDNRAKDRHWQYYYSFVQKNPTNWRDIEGLYPQIRLAWENVPQDRSLLQFTGHLRSFQTRHGLYRDYFYWHKRVLELARKNGWQKEEATALNNLGWIYSVTGHNREAIEYYKESIRLEKELANYPEIAVTLTNLGLAQKHLGEIGQAVNCYNDATRIREEIGDYRGLAKTLNNLGGLYLETGRYKEALKVYRKALRLRKKVGDQNGAAITLLGLGALYLEMDLPESALDFFEMALTLQVETGDLSGLAKTNSDIGDVYYKLGQYGKAGERYHQSRVIWERIDNREEMAGTINKLGLVHEKLGQIEEAFDYLQRAISINEEIGCILGESTSRFHYARLLSKIGLVVEASFELGMAIESSEYVHSPYSNIFKLIYMYLDAQITSKSKLVHLQSALSGGNILAAIKFVVELLIVQPRFVFYSRRSRKTIKRLRVGFDIVDKDQLPGLERELIALS